MEPMVDVLSLAVVARVPQTRHFGQHVIDCVGVQSYFQGSGTTHPRVVVADVVARAFVGRGLAECGAPPSGEVRGGGERDRPPLDG